MAGRLFGSRWWAWDRLGSTTRASSRTCPGVELGGRGGPERGAGGGDRLRSTRTRAFAALDELPPVDGVVIAAPTRLHREPGRAGSSSGAWACSARSPWPPRWRSATPSWRPGTARRRAPAGGAHRALQPRRGGHRPPTCRDPGFLEVHRLGVFVRRSLDVDVVLDLMIHDIEIAQSLVGRPVEQGGGRGRARCSPPSWTWPTPASPSRAAAWPTSRPAASPGRGSASCGSSSPRPTSPWTTPNRPWSTTAFERGTAQADRQGPRRGGEARAAPLRAGPLRRRPARGEAPPRRRGGRPGRRRHGSGHPDMHGDG